MHWEPNPRAPSSIRSGRASAAVLTLTLVGAGDEEVAHVGGGAHAAADGQRHETLVGGSRDHIKHGASIVG